MTILAGIVSRTEAEPLDDSLCEALRSALSRTPGEPATVYRDARAFLAKVDIGAYGVPAYGVSEAGSVAMLAGEPLLRAPTPGTARSRREDLELLHEAWDRDDWTRLADARGVFSAAHYDPRRGTLTLVSDKLGIRPLYYSIGERYVAFASAMRILESLPNVCTLMDVRAVTEATSLGFPLGIRTPYATVSLLRAAELVRVGAQGVSRQQYWRWDDLPSAHSPHEELMRGAFERFTAAVATRLRSDRTTVAFLSGGLDSRCVLAALRARGTQVYTFNFARAGTQDQLFGAQFARQIGTVHHEVPMGNGRPQWSRMMAESWRTSATRVPVPPERPQLVWSGDGGSVGLGHVYMSRAIVEHMRAGRRRTAISTFLEQQQASVLRRLLKPAVARTLANVLHAGVREELEDIHCEDPGRGFHLFLMLNDQRRHLAQHFEDIDLHRLEFHLPFLDSDFLALVLAAPADLFLGHLFYTQWLALFPPVVTSVPWQTYPDHVPCPVPVAAAASDQWNAARTGGDESNNKRGLLREADELLRARVFPTPLLRKSYLRLATWVYRAGLRDYGYVIESARAYQTYWARSGGSYTLPARAPQQG